MNKSFVLQLSKPHDQIIITRPRLDDAEEILPILNDDRVYPWMGAGLPYPHRCEHALRWLSTVSAACNLGQEDVHTRAEAVAGHEDMTPPYVRQCPVRILRETTEADQEIYIGDCGIGRWNFQDITDEQERKRRKEENNAKNAGDPTIIWSIGYYLHPDYHGKGIMKAAIGALINWSTVNMNVRHIRTTAMEGNEPSVRALKHNNFLVEQTLPDSALKAGVKVGLHILEWKANP